MEKTPSYPVALYGIHKRSNLHPQSCKRVRRSHSEKAIPRKALREGHSEKAIPRKALREGHSEKAIPRRPFRESHSK
ncbi:hypothetical protein POVWA2_031590 [Plasmodium ovale wallikeri]|uniref:Uncharacterized protein n=1 Tax=Plasmodium ovale wallikeri TaxID=864142 RepID=A0A1A8YX77_PLAOA|nr:hypothetical protein POVWA1_031870 [Plasmodium ovale wallikeri]SBT36727.1 hypothetical protein POVWA2_031590 [Plasmodium ovale wallikeri]